MAPKMIKSISNVNPIASNFPVDAPQLSTIDNFSYPLRFNNMSTESAQCVSVKNPPTSVSSQPNLYTNNIMLNSFATQPQVPIFATS